MWWFCLKALRTSLKHLKPGADERFAHPWSHHFFSVAASEVKRRRNRHVLFCCLPFSCRVGALHQVLCFGSFLLDRIRTQRTAMPNPRSRRSR